MTFTFFAARRTDATAKGIEKVNGRAIKNVGIFNSNWLELGKDNIATGLIC